MPTWLLAGWASVKAIWTCYRVTELVRGRFSDIVGADFGGAGINSSAAQKSWYDRVAMVRQTGQLRGNARTIRTDMAQSDSRLTYLFRVVYEVKLLSL
jgi:hypothetical protein